MKHLIQRTVALAVVIAVPVTGLGAIGRTEGSFAVSPTGAASYSIPIKVPAGPRGLQPNLALVYNSRGGGGTLGPGWALAGLSSISRCNKTFAQDGAPSAVTLTSSDAFCLNGNRLRPTTGTSYQTEIADFSNVTANGTAGNGPASWTVKSKDGLTYEYGVGGNSFVAATGTTTAVAWMLDKVSDRYGNTMVFDYVAPDANLTGTTVPHSIKWTPSASGSSTYNYTVDFAYTGNNPQGTLVGYVAGTTVVNADLLASISISSSSTVVKKYVFTFDTAPTTGDFRLTQVKECADSAATNCLLPTAITYQNGQAGTATTGTTAVSGTLPRVALRHDFNGDGYADLAYSNGTTWFVKFGSATGYGTAMSTGVAVNSPVDALFADLLGTGADGILAKSGANWSYYTWNGAAFVAASTGLAFDTTATGAGLADIDGDGKPDLVTLNYVASGTNAGNHVYTRLNTSSASTVSFSVSAINAFNNTTTLSGSGELYQGYLITPDSQYSSLRSFDFNGDGRQDLAYSVSECDAFIPDPGGGQACVAYFSYVYELISQPGGTFSSTVALGNINATYSVAYFTNWNNDACTDVIANGSLKISGCNGSIPQSLTPGFAPADAVVSTMDWDGDGRTDIVLANGTALSIQLSTGAGLATSAIPVSIPFTSPCQYGGAGCMYLATLDANGDGLDELVGWTPGSSGNVVYYLHNASGTPPDLLTSITDGYGNASSPSYVSITNGSYTKGTGATFPGQDTKAPLYVDKQVTAPDGIGGTYTQTYSYQGARRNVQGRGFGGFQLMTSTDSRTDSLVTKTTRNTAFPYTGIVSQQDVYQHNGTTLVSQTQNTLDKTDLDATPSNYRVFPFVRVSTLSVNEVGAPKDGLLITTKTTTLTYDSYGNATNVATTLKDEDATSPYFTQIWATTTATTFQTPDTSAAWCVNLPSSVTVTNTAPGGSPIPRRTDFAADAVPAMCRVQQKITEPLSSTYKTTESYLFDVFGNVGKVSVTGIGMATRDTVLNWGTTGQFLMSVTNPLGHFTQFDYDFALGVRNKVTDPNGLQTVWLYDGFGRQTKETRPDLTATTWSYNDCVVAGCVNSNNKVTVVETALKTDATTLTDRTVYLDQFERPLVTSQRRLDGAYDRNEVRIDEFGRPKSQAAPCLWASCSVYWTTLTYDALGRVTKTERPRSAADPLLVSTTVQYAGRTVTETDPEGKQSIKVMTVAGTLGRSQDQNGYYQAFSYDGFGSLLSVTDSLSNPLFSASYHYGLQAFQETVTDMDMGGRTNTFDALGELTAYSDAKSQNFSLTYDALSRPLTRTEPGLTTTWTWGNLAAEHNIGALKRVAADTYAEDYAYDGTGRIASRTITIPSELTYTYDFTYSSTTGLLDTMTYPVSTSSYRLKLQYGYQNGMLQKISDFAAPTTVFWLANQTNARGLVTQETLGNGVITNRSVDDVTGWVSAQTSGVGVSTALQNESYLFDKVGNVTQRQNNNAGLNENFFYDNLHRLDHSTLGGVQNLALTYDATGNITSRSDVAASATWTYDPVKKHAVTQAGSSAYTYSYDANGNAVSRNGYTVTWTSFNHPSQIDGANGESVQFSYNQNHERWRAVYSGSAGTETTLFVGELLEKVLSVGLTDYRHYIVAGGTKVAVYSRTSGTTTANTLRYIREDHQGSISNILNSDGTSYAKESFTAYGKRRSACTWSGDPTAGAVAKINAVSRRGYTWQTALGAMGLNDMNGRIQDAVTGRFLSADPYVPSPARTQSFNRYSYVENKPLTMVDPSGFQLQCWAYTSSFSVTLKQENSEAVAGAQASQYVTNTTTTVTNVCVDFPTYDPGTWPWPPGGGPGGNPAPPPPPPGTPATNQQQSKSNKPQGSSQCHSTPSVHAPASPGHEDDAQAAAASAGLGTADVSLSVAERLSENLKARPNVDLNAVKFVGKGVTTVGTILAAREAIYGKTQEARNLGRQDLAFTAFGEAFPEFAPFVTLPYGVGRVFRDLREAAAEVHASKLLDDAAIQPSGCP